MVVFVYGVGVNRVDLETLSNACTREVAYHRGMAFAGEACGGEVIVMSDRKHDGGGRSSGFMPGCLADGLR